MMNRALFLMALSSLAAVSTVSGQKAAKVAPKHYKVPAAQAPTHFVTPDGRYLLWNFFRERSGKRKTPRRDLCRCAFVQRGKHHLGRHGRRTDSHHAGRRKIVAERHAGATETMEQGFDHRGFAFRRGNGICGDQFLPSG